MKLVFASNNKHKLEEVRKILPANICVISLAELGFHAEIDETGETLEENSAIKAQTIWDWIKAHQLTHEVDGVFADDTGLEIRALGGAPGVRTARWAGEDCNDAANRQKALQELQGITNREARFRTVITLVRGERQEAKGERREARGERQVVIVTYPEALNESVPAPQSLQQQTIPLATEQEIAQSALIQQLIEMQFQRVDFVYEPGQFAVRGGIVDVFSFAHESPYRVDFFGDEIDSIREFDIETQLSQDRLTSIQIVGHQDQQTQEALLIDYLPESTIWASNDFALVRYKCTDERLKTLGQNARTIELAQKSSFDTYDTIAFDTMPQPSFNKNFDLLIDDLRARIHDDYKVYILADQVKQTDRLRAIFEDKESEIRFMAINQTLHAGFVDHAAKICCYTDHQIFERYHRVTLRSENARRGKAIITLKEINQLKIGDYVVHTDHGIGQFAGLVTTNFNGRRQETIKLTYRDGDTIFVSIHNLHRISKYKGREGSEPTISRLGSGAWERMKERTKDKVKDIARDLIRLYATRKQQKGFAYSPDGYMQHELEASFLYEDTPDQAKATLDIKHDMESPMPMDRLVCGDVGFGKTEVAMRAAFKAATDGKQVAVLVPTIMA